MITISLCHELPHPDCDDGSWYRYTVTTQSGRNSAAGFTRGPKATAYAAARRVLTRMEMYEGPRRAWEQFSLSLQQEQPVKDWRINRKQRKRLACAK